MGQIYMVQNLINGKIYIGQTKYSWDKRWKQHLAQLDDGTYFHRAIKKYGAKNFSVTVLENCDDSQLDEREIVWIAKYASYHNGYNSTEGGKQFPKNYEPENILIFYENMELFPILHDVPISIILHFAKFIEKDTMLLYTSEKFFKTVYLSRSMMNKYIKRLVDGGVLFRIEKCRYIVNPWIMGKGNLDKILELRSNFYLK